MKLFRNDYSEICHENVLKALSDSLNEQNIGYGLDSHSENAERIIKDRFGLTDSSVYFLVGGTQTNLTFIAHSLKSYEAVIGVKSAHINVHETGSIEATGHKILLVDGVNGKLNGCDVLNILKNHTDEHMVKPKLVYISNSTEVGSIYTKNELKELYKVCKDNGLYLFIDGARLACALTASTNDLDPKEFASLCDAFYIGGTKNGLLFGEALVINNKDLQKEFRFAIKQRGALLAKGFISGIQFEAIFKDDLYFEIAKNANSCAKYLEELLNKLNLDVEKIYTNQLFVTLSNDLADFIVSKFGCEVWEKYETKQKIRFVTSFMTKKEDVLEVYNTIKKYIESK